MSAAWGGLTSGRAERARQTGRAAPVAPGGLGEASSERGETTLDDVVRQHLPGLLRYATALTGDPEQAADIVQEVLLRAHSRWRRISLTDRPDLYLRRMVTNEHVSWRRRWHVRSIRPAPPETLVERSPVQADHAQRIADVDDLWRSLDELSPRQRSVLVLRYYEGLDDGEIAEVLRTSRATVRSHASHALAALRAQHPSLRQERP